MRILVTGGAGFIGSHLCEALADRGDAVVALDNFDPFYDRQIKESNLAKLRDLPRFTLVEGDIRSRDDLDRAFTQAGKVDLVMHLAALAGVRPSIENPAAYLDVNVRGTTETLEAMRRHGTTKLVFASSSSVYGNNKKVPFHENDPVDHPISPYAASKKACELLLYTYQHLFSLDVTCLRFFTVYGARQRPDLAIHKFARILKAGGKLPMFGDGTTQRDYTYIDDILQGVLAAIDQVEGYHIYNLGESETTTLKTLIETIATTMGVTANIDRQPLQPGDVERTFADISRAKEELAYQPTTTIRKGIPRFIEWFTKHSE